MKSTLGLRLALILAVFIIAVAYLLPSIPAVNDAVKGVVKDSVLENFLPNKQLSQGLDLQGGIYLTLGVGVEKSVETALAQAGDDIRNQAREKGIQITTPRQTGTGIEFTLPDASKQSALDEVIRTIYPDSAMNIARQALPSGGSRYILNFTDSEKKHMEEVALDMVLKTIRNRIDEFGVAEPDIRKLQADNRIVVQLPGIDDTDRAKNIIEKTAHLEFHIEYDPSALDISRVERGILPADAIRLPMQEAGRTGEKYIIVHRNAAMTGQDIADAYQSYDQNNKPAVAMNFNRRGAALFERITGENTKKRMAIVLDGVVHSAPVIQDRIGGGKASITGSFTIAEANDLALVLRAGSLPAPVSVLEERTVGPSLGKQSIEMGTKAALIGVIGVTLFMIVYYSFAGVIAASMVLLDIVLILSGMVMLGATLTLPGIAGIVLTIGMAVDANVLIFERIREELRNGESPMKAIELGFSRATLTILDSNITTIIAAVILYEFGTGPVRGFAVTLTLGILVSMFTAIIVSRAIFDLWVTKKSSTLSI